MSLFQEDKAKSDFIIVASILCLALIIRFYHCGHVLMSDEAQNMLTIKSLIDSEGIRDYFFKHPPLFTIFSSLISYPFGDNHRLVQAVSILFSVASFVPLYMIASDLFDKKTAMLALLVLAVMPVNFVFSTWIKQDAMLLFFFLCSISLYLRDNIISSGFFFGVACLTKEFALFLVPIVLSIELLKGWSGFLSLKRFFVWFFIGFLMSIWWYLFWGGLSARAIDAAVKGGNPWEYAWHFPWFYYLKNLPTDITLLLFPFFVLGFVSIKKGVKLFPLLWILAIYLPLSRIKVKAPWYPYLATPALAIIIAHGLLKVWQWIKIKEGQWALGILLSLMMIFSIYSFNGQDFFQKTMGASGRKLPAINVSELLGKGRQTLKGTHKVALLEYNPMLQYYLGISDSRLHYLGPQFPAMDKEDLVRLAVKNEIDWIMIDKRSVNYIDKNIEEMTDLWGEPESVGEVALFKVNLWNYSGES